MKKPPLSAQRPKKTVGQTRKENPDYLTVTAWATYGPPRPPEQESPIDAFAEGWTGPMPELAELVTKWKIPAETARKVYDSWILAQRRFRKLTTTKKRAPSQKAELLGFVRKEFWLPDVYKTTSQKMKHLAEEIEAIESYGHTVSLSEVETILSGPLDLPNKSFLAWLLKYWIQRADELTPPLCLCTDGFLDTLIEERQKANRKQGNADPDWNTPPVAEALRKIISDFGLVRPAEHRLDGTWRSKGAPGV